MKKNIIALIAILSLFSQAEATSYNSNNGRSRREGRRGTRHVKETIAYKTSHVKAHAAGPSSGSPGEQTANPLAYTPKKPAPASN